jgi:protein O-mannosyl-transferase
MVDQGSFSRGGGGRPLEAGSAGSGSKGTGWWLSAALVGFVVLVHANGLTGRFHFDDTGAILDNPTIRNLFDLPTVLFAPTFATVVNRPLLNLSLAMNYAISGTDPWSYRVVNILIHAFNALLVAWLAHIILSSAAMPDLLKREAAWWSTLGAALWAAHPLTTAAVAYVVQRAEALMSLFFLAGLWALTRGACSQAERDQEPGRGAFQGVVWLAGSVACYLLALATKEVAVMFAPIALLYDRWFLAPNWSMLLAQRGRLHAMLWGTAGLYTVAMLSFTNGRDNTAGFGGDVSPVEYLTTQFVVVCDYLRLTLVPVGQSLDWGMVLITDPAEWVPSLLVLLVLLVPTIGGVLRGARWAFPGAWFFGILAPTSTIVPLITQVAAEQRVYLPLVGLVVGLVVYLRLGLAATGLKSPRPAVVLTLIAIAGCTLQTVRRNALYADPIALWSDAVQNRPGNPRAYSNLMVHLAERGRLEEALELANRALEIPTVKSRRYGPPTQGLAYPQWYNDRGVLHGQMSHRDLALADFNAAVAADPEFPEARANRANCLVDLGRAAEAFPDLAFLLERGLLEERALSIQAWAYLKLGRLEESVESAKALEAAGGRPSPAYIAALREANNRRQKRPAGQVAPRP